MKKSLILNIIVIMLILLLLLLIVMRYFNAPASISNQECVDKSYFMNLRYDLCYDPVSKNIVMNILRGRDPYNIMGISISFLDNTKKDNLLSPVPTPGETKKYRVSASQNPRLINIIANVTIDENLNFCQEPLQLNVRECLSSENTNITAGIIKTNITSQTNPLLNIPKPFTPKDLLSKELVNKNGIWEPVCKSDWLCSDWEDCIGENQRRDCTDKNSCLISSNTPQFIKKCGQTCQEEWVCGWSPCIEGFSTPNCHDLNNCGTVFSKPNKFSCTEKKCIPNIACGEWGDCTISYSFSSPKQGIQTMEGTKKRLCADKSNCLPSQLEIKNCSVRIDISSREIIFCNQRYIEIYNKETNKAIARIKNEMQNNHPLIEVSLDSPATNTTEKCDYCSDGIKDFDETGLDCGGSSCFPCKIEPYPSNFLSVVSNWLRSLIGM